MKQLTNSAHNYSYYEQFCVNAKISFVKTDIKTGQRNDYTVCIQSFYLKQKENPR